MLARFSVGVLFEKSVVPESDCLHLVVPAAAALIGLLEAAPVGADVDAAGRARAVAQGDRKGEVAKCGCGVRHAACPAHHGRRDTGIA